MSRCLFCDRRVWPWERQGWRVGVSRWHARCERIADWLAEQGL